MVDVAEVHESVDVGDEAESDAAVPTQRPHALERQRLQPLSRRRVVHERHVLGPDRQVRAHVSCKQGAVYTDQVDTTTQPYTRTRRASLSFDSNAKAQRARKSRNSLFRWLCLCLNCLVVRTPPVQSDVELTCCCGRRRPHQFVDP